MYGPERAAPFRKDHGRPAGTLYARFLFAERIAETAAQWAADPGTKVAVRIWAVEVLKHCRERVGWVAEAWDDLVETMAHGATPGIECRMRKSWKPGRSDKA
ncbi:MAG: hypothetical protein ACLRM8_01335 [Alistipes sp.]